MVSTLALKKSDFESEVGDWAGWGRGDTPLWTPVKKTRIQMDVASGLRRFYFNGHPWSFLKPSMTLTLDAGAANVLTTLKLPEDFNGIDGQTRVTVSQSADGLARWVMDFTGAARVIQAHALCPTATGIPTMVALRPIKQIAVGQMQRSELIIYPIPDQEYQLTFAYTIAPNYLLDATQPYAYGGIEHHETILACCLAAFEQRRDNAIGPQSVKADELLQRSISMDRMRQPIRLGYSRDLSDACISGPLGELGGQWNGHGYQLSQGVEIDGNTYT